MIVTVTDERLPPSRRIAKARRAYDAAYGRLIAAIREELADKAVTVTEAASQAQWSREYIGQIRDGEAGDAPPKRRSPGAAGR